MIVNASKRYAYTPVARLLHWLVALLVFSQFLIGWVMPDVKKDTAPIGLIAWHLAIGAVIIGAVIIRFFWRITHKPSPSGLPPVLARMSSATHAALYFLLIVVPLAGWANASSRGWSVKLFGLIPLPSLCASGSATGHTLGDVHGWLAWVLFAFITLHILAALFHRFVLHDNVLRRML